MGREEGAKQGVIHIQSLVLKFFKLVYTTILKF